MSNIRTPYHKGHSIVSTVHVSAEMRAALIRQARANLCSVSEQIQTYLEGALESPPNIPFPPGPFTEVQSFGTLPEVYHAITKLAEEAGVRRSVLVRTYIQAGLDAEEKDHLQ